MPSGILIHLTVWPQTDRTGHIGKRDNGPIAYGDRLQTVHVACVISLGTPLLRGIVNSAGLGGRIFQEEYFPYVVAG